MGCISEILRITTDKNLFKTGDLRSVIVEGGGIYKDYEYLITFVDRGHRCGYVAIDKTNKYYGKDLTRYDENIVLEVHGGITFHNGSHMLKSLLIHPCEDQWLGFDAAHSMDKPCLKTAKKYFGESPYLTFVSDLDYKGITGIKHRTFKYMEKECKNLIEQLRGEAA